MKETFFKPSLRGARRATKQSTMSFPRKRESRSWIPDTFGEERHIIVDNVKVVTISAGAKAPASSSQTLSEMSDKLIPKSARAKGAQRSAPRISASVKAFGDDTSCQIASPDRPSGTGEPSGQPPLNQPAALIGSLPRNDVVVTLG